MVHIITKGGKRCGLKYGFTPCHVLWLVGNIYPNRHLKFTLVCFLLYGQGKRGRKEGETPPLLFYA
nr:MAG TPA: hypothetical protein [Caudoviricetes sp.]